jgi:predicted transcriptional regulator of viral defense system
LTISNYIKQLQSYEEYAFSWNELLENCNKTDISLKRELSRLVEKKEIINLRKGFYLIIPPRYSKQEQLPIQLYIDKLFKKLERDYYLGFYSAAKFHGASHQQVQRDYIMMSAPVFSNIKKNAIDIRFLNTSKWPKKNILQKKSDAGIFKLSSPALTSVDLIHHQTKLGGLNRMLAVLEELFEEISQNDIVELLTWYPHKSTLQRFGFLLEELQANDNLTKQIKEHLQQSKFFPVLLSPKSKQKPRAIYNAWKVDVNIKIESDL